jgi:hypothetical protein
LRSDISHPKGISQIRQGFISLKKRSRFRNDCVFSWCECSYSIFLKKSSNINGLRAIKQRYLHQKSHINLHCLPVCFSLMLVNFLLSLEKLLILVYNLNVKLAFLGVEAVKDYISVREASYKWGVSERRVNQFCTQGRIPGLTRFGRSWCIPADAEKPTDPRKNKPGKGGA